DTNGTLGTYDDSWSFIGHSDVYGLGIDSAGALWTSLWLFPQYDLALKYDSQGNPFPGHQPVSTGGWGHDRGVAVRWSDGTIWVANSGELEENPEDPSPTQDVSRLEIDGAIRSVVP